MIDATPTPERPRALRRPRTPGHARAGDAPWLLRGFVALVGVLARVFDAGEALHRARRGPWRVAVEEGSMAPALLPGDWLLVDPTTSRWPRRGALVVVREPESEVLVVKRVAARPRDALVGPGGPTGGAEPIRLGPYEAWLLGDAAEVSLDSRRYGPIDVEQLVGRAWFRYGPRGRTGLLDTRPR